MSDGFFSVSSGSHTKSIFIQPINIHMRYREFKKTITEATIAASTPSSIPTYIANLNQLLSTNQTIPAGKQGEINFVPDPNQKVNSIADVIKGKIDNKPAEIQVSKVFKSADVKGKAGRSFNLGNATEGMFATAIYTRLITDKDISIHQLKSSLAKLPPHNKNGITVGPASVKDRKGVTDKIQLFVKLDISSYNGIKDPQSLQNLIPHLQSIVNYVNNEEVKTLTNEFKNNGTVDSVKVISDGVTDAKSSKVDVEVVYLNEKGERKVVRYERSVKTGGVKQFGQVTAGGAKPEDDSGKGISRTERYDLQEQFWDDFEIDISASEDDFIDWPDFVEAYDFTYAEAAKQLNAKLQGDKKEKQTVKNIFDVIKKHGFGDRPNAKTVDFGPKGYKVLDYKKLDDFIEKTDLSAKFIKEQKRPGVAIQDQKGKDFVIIRLYKGETKMTNMIERGPALEQIVKVKEG